MSMSQRRKRQAIIGMPATGTEPDQYRFWKPRVYDYTRLTVQLNNLRTIEDQETWSTLKDNLYALWNILGLDGTFPFPVDVENDPAVKTKEVENVIGQVADAFLVHIGVVKNAENAKLLYQDIHREVSFCTRPSALSRLLLLYAGGEYKVKINGMVKTPTNPMVFTYQHHTQTRPRNTGRKGFIPELKHCTESHLRFRPATYASMAACSALQHAITRNKDTDGGGKLGGDGITHKDRDFADYMVQGSAMVEAAATFLEPFLIENTP